MYSIAYVIPYFGKFKNYFQLWLNSCAANPTVDFLIFTDDQSQYDYPTNVKVTYTTFDNIKNRIQSLYDFEISLEKPYRLCDFKVAYGEIFSKELEEYDYWGFCDIDLVWGNIRKFITNEILETYDRIGFLGHSSIYKNTEKINSTYKLDYQGEYFYKKAFTEDKTHFFDEWKSLLILRQHGYKCYTNTIMADISNLYWHFYLCYFNNSDDYKNDNQIFFWNQGELLRIYLDKRCGKQIEEYMYIHLISRDMDIVDYDINKSDCFMIVPNKFIFNSDIKSINNISEQMLKKLNKKSIIKYLLWWYKKEKTWYGVFKYIKNTLRPRYKIIFENNFKII